MPADETTTKAAEIEPAVETPKTPETVDWEARAKELEGKLKGANKEASTYRKDLEKYQQAEAERKQAELTDLQKAEQRAADAEKKAAELALSVLRRQVVDETGLPPALADRLQGKDADELKADALKLLEALPKPTEPKKQVNANARNPGDPKPQEESLEAFRKRREAMIANPWDPQMARAKGGGVFIANPEE